MRHGPGYLHALIAAFGITGIAVERAHASAAPNAGITVTVTGLRSTKGQVLACMTTRPQDFPQCDRDPAARKIIIPAGETVNLNFGKVPHGRYAVAIVHDENGNGKLDKRLIVPREGYGFSRDAPVRMGPPSFESAAFEAAGDDLHLSVRMRYLL